CFASAIYFLKQIFYAKHFPMSRELTQPSGFCMSRFHYFHSVGLLSLNPVLLMTSSSNCASTSFFLPIIMEPLATNTIELLCRLGGKAINTLLSVNKLCTALMGGVKSLSPEISMAMSYSFL